MISYEAAGQMQLQLASPFVAAAGLNPCLLLALDDFSGMGFPVRTKRTGNTEHMFCQWGLVGTGNREQRTSHEMPRRAAGG